MSGNRPEVSAPKESAGQLEAHHSSSHGDAAAATAMAGGRCQLVEVQEGSAAVVAVAAAPEHARLCAQNLENSIGLDVAHQAAGSDGAPEQVSGPLSGPHMAAGLQPDMSSQAAASTAHLAKAKPRAVGSPHQAPAPPAQTVVAASVKAVASSPAPTVKVQQVL